MNTKAFVQDTIFRSLGKYLELHPDISDLKAGNGIDITGDTVSVKDEFVKWNNTREGASKSTLTSYKKYNNDNGSGLFQMSTREVNSDNKAGDMDINLWTNRPNNGGPRLEFFVCNQDGEPMELIQTVDLSDTGWIELDNDYVNGLSYRRKNGVVFIEFNNPGTIKQSIPVGPTFVTIGTLPVGFRPSIVRSVQIAASYGEAFGVAQILSNGTIQIRMFAGLEYNAANPRYITGSTSYPV